MYPDPWAKLLTQWLHGYCTFQSFADPSKLQKIWILSTQCTAIFYLLRAPLLINFHRTLKLWLSLGLCAIFQCPANVKTALIFHIATVSIVHTSVCVCVFWGTHISWPYPPALPPRRGHWREECQFSTPPWGCQQGHWLLFLQMLFKTLIGRRHGKGSLWQPTWVKKN